MPRVHNNLTTEGECLTRTYSAKLLHEIEHLYLSRTKALPNSTSINSPQYLSTVPYHQKEYKCGQI